MVEHAVRREGLEPSASRRGLSGLPTPEGSLELQPSPSYQEIPPVTHRALVLALSLTIPALPATAAESDPLAGSEWRPVEIAGTATPEEVEVFLQFGADGVVSGMGGCNRFTGNYTLTDTSIGFSPLAATMMACPDPQMEVEQRLFKALSEVRGFARDRIDLVLSDADGAPLVVLTQNDAD